MSRKDLVTTDFMFLCYILTVASKIHAGEKKYPVAINENKEFFPPLDLLCFSLFPHLMVTWE